MLAFTLTLTDDHTLFILALIAALGVVSLFIGASRADSYKPDGKWFMISGAALVVVALPCLITLIEHIDNEKEADRIARQLEHKHADLPDPWFDIFDELSQVKSPQLKDVLLRKRMEAFSCANTLPMAGFDRFMEVTSGEASETLEPCLIIPVKDN